MQNKIHYDMDEKEYRALDRLNFSSLKEFEKSGRHFLASKLATRKPTKAMEIGRAVHSAILEPKKFDRDYVVSPEGLDLRTKAGKEWASENADKNVLTPDDFSMISGIRKNLDRHPMFKEIFGNGGRSEVTVLFDHLAEVACKARLDFVNHDGSVIVDIKTVEDARPEAFIRSVISYGYHFQAYFYSLAWFIATGNKPTFIFLAVEKGAPNEVMFHCLDVEFLLIAEKKISEMIAKYKRSIETGVFEGYPAEINYLAPPGWIK